MKIKKRYLFPFCACLTISVAQALEVGSLRTQYLQNPLGIDEDSPSFSWKLKAEKRATVQNSYQLELALEPEMENIIFDSGTIISNQSTNVRFDSMNLQASTRYYWRVTITDNYGNVSQSTDNSYFETGLRDSGWSGAMWIRSDYNSIETQNLTGFISKNNLFSNSRSHDVMVTHNEEEGAPYFRKEFRVEGPIKKARLYSTALGVFTAHINGKRVGHLQHDGSMIYDELMPGWTDYRSSIFYMTHDVTSLLQEGENVIGAVVSSGWWKGDVSHGIYKSTNVAFLGKLVITLQNGEEIIIVTDETWKTSRSGAIREGEIYHGEIYDARLDDNWSEVDYDTSLWLPVREDDQNHGQVMSHEGTLVRVMNQHERKPKTIIVYEGITDNGTTYGEIAKVNEFGNQSVTLKKDQIMIIDFGQNASGWAKFKVKGRSGTTLKLRFSEILNDSGEAERGNDDAKGTLYTKALRNARASCQYVLCGNPEGEEYRPTTTFYGFRYADLTANEDIEIEWIIAETISSIAEENSFIEVDNPDVNQLYSNILWGERSNFISVPTDCPQRDERLGWTADTQVFSMAAMYNSQVQGFYHKWMRDMRDGQLEDGRFPNVAPHNWVGFASAAWADAGVILPWNVYVMYGDKSIIEENYESMERYFDWLGTQSEEGYQHIGSDITYGDWLAFEKTDNRFVSVAYYGYMADIMSKMSKVLSTTEEDIYYQKSVKYSQLFQEIREEFKDRYWEDQTGLSQTSQCAYLMALRYGLLPDEAAENLIIEKLREKIEGNNYTLSTGFLGTAILNQTLSQFGMDDLAYSLLLQHDCPSWLYSVDQGATTLWEKWNSYTIEDGINKSVGMNSFNHYAYGAVAEWMYRYMVGISPDYNNPGFSHVLLKPCFDPERRINYVNAEFDSNYGIISAAWQTTKEGEYIYNLTLPANTTAKLTLPILPEKDLFDGDLPIEEVEGISGIRELEGNITMTLGSGTYNFHNSTKNNHVSKKETDKLLIWPNPATDIVNVRSAKTIDNIRLFSLSGAIVAESSGKESLNIGGCQSGIYILVVKTTYGEIYREKLIIK